MMYPSPANYARPICQPLLRLPDGIEHLTFAKLTDYTAALRDGLAEHLPRHIRSAVPSRQYEYGLGRIVASTLLAKLGVDSRDLWVGTQERRPVWPTGIVGSISHSPSLLTICAGLRSSNLRSIGLDIEELTQSSEENDALDLCFQADETPIIDSIPHGRLIGFSAKEALFKCLNPLTDVFFDFAAARLISIDSQSGSWVVELRSTISREFPLRTRLGGSFQFFEQHVFAAVSWPQLDSTQHAAHGRLHSQTSVSLVRSSATSDNNQPGQAARSLDSLSTDRSTEEIFHD